jgi:hypothetical protein
VAWLQNNGTWGEFGMAFGKKRELRTHWQRIDAAGLPPELMRRLSPGLGAQQERIIDCFAKSHGGLDIAPEKRNDDLIVNDPSLAIGQRSIGSESEADNIVNCWKSERYRKR